MRTYKNTVEETKTPEEKKAEHDRLMKEFLAKGGKVEQIPYGVTNQDLGSSNINAFYSPPSTVSPKTWRTRKTKAQNKKDKK
jgi:hypothetical protein